MARIDVRKAARERNDAIAAETRKRLGNCRVLNLIGSPGAGKTALLERTAEALGNALAVIDIADLSPWSGKMPGSFSRFNFISGQVAVELSTLYAAKLDKQMCPRGGCTFQATMTSTIQTALLAACFF